MVCIRRHKEHDYATYDQLAPNFGMTYKIIQQVSVPNLKLFESMKTELSAKDVGEFLLCCYMGKWVVGILLPTNMAAAV